MKPEKVKEALDLSDHLFNLSYFCYFSLHNPDGYDSTICHSIYSLTAT